MEPEISDFLIRPPWHEYPGSEPSWGGWRQGTGEAWLRDVWLPFWKPLSPEGRDAYLARWPPPDDEWSYYVKFLWA